jgi:hypothetical protein
MLLNGVVISGFPLAHSPQAGPSRSQARGLIPVPALTNVDGRARTAVSVGARGISVFNHGSAGLVVSTCFPVFASMWAQATRFPFPTKSRHATEIPSTLAWSSTRGSIPWLAYKKAQSYRSASLDAAPRAQRTPPSCAINRREILLPLLIHVDATPGFLCLGKELRRVSEKLPVTFAEGEPLGGRRFLTGITVLWWDHHTSWAASSARLQQVITPWSASSLPPHRVGALGRTSRGRNHCMAESGDAAADTAPGTAVPHVGK